MLKGIFNKFFGKETPVEEVVQAIEDEVLEEETAAEPSLLDKIPDGVVICSMKESEQYFTNQGEFSAAIGVSQGLVSSWKNGHVKISPKAAKRVLIKTQGKVDLFKFSEYSG